MKNFCYLIILLAFYICQFSQISCASALHQIATHEQLEDHPFIIQMTTHPDGVHKMLHAMCVAYNQTKGKPELTSRWHYKLEGKVSNLLLVESANYPFFDQWPQIPGYPNAPESSIFAQSYLSFKKSTSNRPTIIYQVQDGFFLRGYQALNGNKQIDINLADLLDMTIQDDPFFHSTKIEITSMDVFYQYQWHTILVGCMGGKDSTIFCLDITDPYKISQSFPRTHLLWKWQFKEAYCSSPRIYRAVDQYWKVVVGVQKGTTSNLYTMSARTGDIDEVTVLAPLQINHAVALDSANLTTALFISPLDTQARGAVDYMYIADDSGRLFRQTIQEASSAPKVGVEIFSLTDLAFSGKFVTEPRVILHPNKGHVVVLLAESVGKRYLISLWDSLEKTDVLWYTEVSQNETELMIRSQRVLVQYENYAITYDIHTGKVYQKVSYQLSCDSVPLAYIGPPLIFSIPDDFRNLLLHSLGHDHYAWTWIDLESDKLGRRSWRIN